MKGRRIKLCEKDILGLVNSKPVTDIYLHIKMLENLKNRTDIEISQNTKILIDKQLKIWIQGK